MSSPDNIKYLEKKTSKKLTKCMGGGTIELGGETCFLVAYENSKLSVFVIFYCHDKTLLAKYLAHSSGGRRA